MITNQRRAGFLVRIGCFTALGALALAGCGGGDGGGTGTAGATGAAGKGGTTGSAGTMGSAGTLGSAGTTGRAGTTGSGGGGTTGTGGSSGSTGTGGSSGTTGTGGGGATGGSGGGAAGTGGAAGSGGATGAGGRGGAAGGGGGGRGGSAGGGGGTGGSGTGGATNCAGNALSLSANGFGTGTTGANNDAAASRVDVDFGSTSADLPLMNSQRTVEFWAYIPSTSWVGNANTLYFYGSTARPAHGFGLDFGASAVTGMTGNHATLDPYTNGGFDADSNAYLGITSSSNQWVHLAMTWDGTAVRTFVNGVERITKMGDSGTTALATDRSAIAIGGYEQDGNYFNGYIDEFRVWNVAHTAAQITATMSKTLVGNETGLVLYLKFDETSGASARDSVTTSGHTAHNGVLMSANGMLPTFITSTAPVGCP